MDNGGNLRQLLLNAVRKPRIIIDLNNTLAGSMKVAEWLFEQKTGVPFSVDDREVYELVERSVVEDAAARLFVIEMWEEHGDRIKPLIEPNKLKEVARHSEVNVMSVHPTGIEKYIDSWLNKNYPDIGLRIKTVSSVAEKLNMDCDIYVEDGPSFAEKFRERNFSNKSAIIIQQKYNGGVNCDAANMSVVKTSNEAMDLLLSAARVGGRKKIRIA